MGKRLLLSLLVFGICAGIILWKNQRNTGSFDAIPAEAAAEAEALNVEFMKAVEANDIYGFLIDHYDQPFNHNPNSKDVTIYFAGYRPYKLSTKVEAAHGYDLLSTSYHNRKDIVAIYGDDVQRNLHRPLLQDSQTYPDLFRRGKMYDELFITLDTVLQYNNGDIDAQRFFNALYQIPMYIYAEQDAEGQYTIEMAGADNDIILVIPDNQRMHNEKAVYGVDVDRIVPTSLYHLVSFAREHDITLRFKLTKSRWYDMYPNEWEPVNFDKVTEEYRKAL